MPCECSGPGWCARHMVNKGERWHELCKTREDYFDVWEMGEGPGQNFTEEQKEDLKKQVGKDAITKCDCNFSMNYDIDTGKGFCDRHKCWKDDRQKKLCQLDREMFDDWEMGDGPGQEDLSEDDKSKLQEKIRREQPGLFKKIWNFSKALKNHVSDGARAVSDEVYEKRLNECDQCVYREGNKCLHASCGCNLTHKAKWNSEQCPIGRWQHDDQPTDQ